MGEYYMKIFLMEYKKLPYTNLSPSNSVCHKSVKAHHHCVRLKLLSSYFPNVKRWIILSGGEGVGKREPSYTAGERFNLEHF